MARMKALPNSSPPLVATEVSEIGGCISEDGCDTGKFDRCLRPHSDLITSVNSKSDANLFPNLLVT